LNAVALIYHDVTQPGAGATSGRRGAGPAMYKLDCNRFEAHLNALAEVPIARRGTWSPGLDDAAGEPVLLTFDDGGISAATEIAPRLERHGWRGHFFVTTRDIGTPGYLDRAAIRDLATAGHVIGSHSASHPDLFAALPGNAQAAEWHESLSVLGDILGTAVRVASVPGGLYDPQVGRIAAEAGLAGLFNSEPTVKSLRCGDCVILGRFSIMQRTEAGEVGQIVNASALRRERHAALWAVKKAVRRVGGERYLRFRRAALAALGNRSPGTGDDGP
jgi:hypothetical protein